MAKVKPTKPIDPLLKGILSAVPQIREVFGSSAVNLGGRPGLADVRSRAADLQAILGSTDYSKQLQQSQDAAKLQAALSLAARGFASMGATPKRGESPFATVGRELLAPVGADLIPVATKFMERKAAIDAAKQAEDRQVKLAAYTQAAAGKKDIETATLSLATALAKKTRGKLGTTPYMVVKKTDEGKVVPSIAKDRKAPTQVRLRPEGGQNTLHSNQPYTLKPNETIISRADWEKRTGTSDKQGTRGWAKRLSPKNEPIGDPFPVNYVYRDGAYNFYAVGSKDKSPIIVEGVGKNAVLVNDKGQVFGPDPETDPTITGNFVLTDKNRKGIYDPDGSLIQLRQEGGRWIRTGSDIAYDSLKEIPGAEKIANPQAMPAESYFKIIKDSKPSVSDAGLAQEYIQDPKYPNDPSKLILGPVVETKVVSKNGALTQVRADNNKEIKIGSAKGSYKMYLKPFAPKDPKGVDSADAKANFEGFLNRFPAIQEAGALADTSIKFDPFRHKAGQQPFTYLNGTPLSDDDGKRILRMIETDYFNLYDKGFKAGQDPVDINQRAVTNFLKRSLHSYGLKPPVLAPGAQRPPSQLKSKQAQLTRYMTAPTGFNTQPVAAETLDNMPVPNIANYKNGIGRLKVFQELGVPFGADTTSPAPLSPNLPSQQLGEALNNRSAEIARLSDDPDPIQTRVDAEALSKGTSLAATLTSQANTPEKRDAAVAKALEKVRENRATIQAKPGNKVAAKELGAALAAYRNISRMRLALSRSGVPGFFTGPIEVGARKYVGLEIGAWFRTPEGQRFANEFIATLPVMGEIVSRQLLRGAGEGAKMSDKDLKGMKGVLPKAGQNFEYEVDKINALDRYLKAGIQSMLEGIGDFAPSKTLLTQAATLGFDLKEIKGKNNYYDPFLKDSRYKVSKQAVPSYSKENQTQLRDKGVLDFVSKSVPGKPIHYELMVIDVNGQPIWDVANNKWTTTIVNEAGLKNPNNRDLVRFNTDWLKREHKLDR